MKKENKINVLLVIVVVVILGIIGVYAGFSQKQFSQHAQIIVEQNAKMVAIELCAYIDSEFSNIQEDLDIDAKSIMKKDFENVDQILATQFYGKDMIGVLVDANNQVIASTIDVEENTDLDSLLWNIGILGRDRETFLQNIENKNVNAFFIEGKKGKTLACVRNIEKTNWSVIQIVPASTYKQVIYRNTRGTYIPMVFAIILVALMHYVRIDSKRKHQKIMAEKNRQVENYEQILTATAANSFKGVRRIDLETAHGDYIFFEDNMFKQQEIGDWTKWLVRQEQNVHPNDVERVKAVLGIQNLRDMKEGVTYSINYRSAKKNNAGIHKAYTTNICIISVEGRPTAVMTTIDNTEAVESEMEQQRLLISAASIYVSMHVIDLKNDILETLNCAEHISEIIGNQNDNVQSIIQKTMYKLTDEQYRDAMMEFIDFSTLDERMEGVNTITLEFLGTVSGWCRGRFIAVDYDETGRLSQILWVVENIDVEKRKANHLKYLSETDLMTGIRNRGSGEHKIKEYITKGHQGMFCLLDADKFKSINDIYGHGVGDQVLIAIAACLKETFRDSDVVMRLGGDEFAAFAEGITDKKMATPLLQELMERINGIDIPQLKNHKISVSLGAAFKLKDDGADFELLYHNADSCTYKSKNVSGNAYTFFE